MRPRIKLLGTALVAAALTALAAIAAPTPASAATLTEVTNFGTNPSNLQMYLYVPDNVAARPAILVAVHYCTGTRPGVLLRHPVRLPRRPVRLHRDLPVGDPQQQVLRRLLPAGAAPRRRQRPGRASCRWSTTCKQRYNADPNRIFVTGASSGAMMTNVLLGDYPDVFKAGAAFAGVPFGCFATTNGSEWNSECANGQVTKTAAAVGRPGPRRLPRLHRRAAADADLARHQRRHPALPELRRADQAVDQRPRPEPDADASPTPRSPAGPAPGTAAAAAPRRSRRSACRASATTCPVDAAQAIRFFGLDAATHRHPRPAADLAAHHPRPTPPTTATPTTLHARADHAGGPLPGRLHRQRLEHRPDRGDHDHQHRQHGGQRVGAGVHPARPGRPSPPAGTPPTRRPAGRSPPATSPTTRTSRPSASVSIGFQATHTGNTGKPASFTLNGSACTVA